MIALRRPFPDIARSSRMTLIRNTLLALAMTAIGPVQTAGAQVLEMQALSYSGGIRQLAFDRPSNTLFIGDGGTSITVLKLNQAGAPSQRVFAGAFTDMDLSPSGRYLYATSSGGENAGSPIGQQSVYRYDTVTGSWSTQSSQRVSGMIEAIDDERFILQSRSNQVKFSVNQWGPGDEVIALGTELSTNEPRGISQFDATNNRLLHGDCCAVTGDVRAFQVQGNELIQQERSNTALIGGGPLVLSTDGAMVYHGNEQFASQDLSVATRIFAENIIGATSLHAFSTSNYYNAQTGELMGALNGDFRVFAFSGLHSDFWAYDSARKALVHLSAVPEPTSFVLMGLGLLAVGGTRASRRRASR